MGAINDNKIEYGKKVDIIQRILDLENIGTKMSMSELSDDIEDLLLKYESGTDLQHITVHDFKIISYLIRDIIINPNIYLNKDIK